MVNCILKDEAKTKWYELKNDISNTIKTNLQKQYF